MIAAFVRLILKVKISRGLHVDDYFLIFACACLTAATALGYANVGKFYLSQARNYNQTQSDYFLAEHVDVAAEIDAYERLFLVYPALLWTTIFTVKFGYLAFFRRLVDRIEPLITYWKVIVGISCISWAICVASIYIGCFKWNLAAGKCFLVHFPHLTNVLYQSHAFNPSTFTVPLAWLSLISYWTLELTF